MSDAQVIYLESDVVVISADLESVAAVVNDLEEPATIESTEAGPQGPPGELGVYSIEEYEALAIKKVAVIHGTEAPPAPTGYPDGMMYFKY